MSNLSYNLSKQAGGVYQSSLLLCGIRSNEEFSNMGINLWHFDNLFHCLQTRHRLQRKPYLIRHYCHVSASSNSQLSARHQ